MIWNLVRSYLLIGECVIAFEWAILISAKEGVLFTKNLKPAEKAVCAVIVFIVEVVIWPRQIFAMISNLYRLLFGKLTNYEWAEILKEDCEK